MPEKLFCHSEQNESCPRGETHFQGQDSFFAIAIARDD